MSCAHYLFLACLLALPTAKALAGSPEWTHPAVRDGVAETIELRDGESPVTVLMAEAVGGARKQGAVVLLADRGEQPGSSGVIAPLFELRRFGWAALGPALPQEPPPPAREQPPSPSAAEDAVPGNTPAGGEAKRPPATEPPKKDEPREAGGEEGNAPATPPQPVGHIGPEVIAPLPARDSELLDAMGRRIEATLGHLEQGGAGNVILIGHGRGAVAALAYAVAHPGRVDGLVLVGLPARQGADPRLDTLKLLSQLKVPALDIYGDQETPEVVATADRRRLAAATHLQLAPPTFGRIGTTRERPAPQEPIYRQVAIRGAHHGMVGFEEMLFRRVRGWLDRHARMESRPVERPAAGKPDGGEKPPAAVTDGKTGAPPAPAPAAGDKGTPAPPLQKGQATAAPVASGKPQAAPVAPAPTAAPPAAGAPRPGP